MGRSVVGGNTGRENKTDTRSTPGKESVFFFLLSSSHFHSYLMMSLACIANGVLGNRSRSCRFLNTPQAEQAWAHQHPSPPLQNSLLPAYNLHVTHDDEEEGEDTCRSVKHE